MTAFLTSTVRVAALRSSSLALGLGMALTAPALADTQASKSVVIVTGHASTKATQQSGIDKLTQPLIDTPQSVSVISRIELDDRGITTLSDALRTTPGISLGAGETSFQGNNVILRGFTTRNDTYLDGMRDYGYYYRDPFDEDSIEVLKGPSSVLFGRGSTGGVIEQTTKQALVGQHFLDAQVQVGTDQTHRLTADANTPLGDGLGAVRLNAMVHKSGVSGRDGARNSRWGLAPSLFINLSPDTQLRFDWLHLECVGDGLPDPGDKHVLAAALKTQAAMLVTENLKDFPEATLAPLNIEARSADAFIADTISLDTGRAVAAIRKMRERFNKPEMTAEQLLVAMEAAGLTDTVDVLRPHALSL